MGVRVGVGGNLPQSHSGVSRVSRILRFIYGPRLFGQHFDTTCLVGVGRKTRSLGQQENIGIDNGPAKRTQDNSD